MSRLTEWDKHEKGIWAKDSDGYFQYFEQDDEAYLTLCKLAHYEDLEEQGRLIELPCKVGDTVYHLAHGYIEPEKVRGYTVHFSTDVYGFTDDKYGKTVFPTKEEAEAKLAELGGRT